jgi:hypothetical protein
MVDLGPFAWYKLTAVKILATTALDSRLAFDDATSGRGNFTAYYWRFS